MLGLDHVIEALGSGGSTAVVLAVAVLLGLRHALDPDHLVAVSTLVAGEDERRVRRATVLGVAWGLGHGTTLVLVGVPAVVFGADLPASLEQACEVLVGLVIMALALRLVWRWRRGRFHAHEHAHGGVVHRHLHPHRDGGHGHEHAQAPRSPLQGYGVGLVHGLAGSGAVVILLLATIGDRWRALAALLLFAAAAAASMAALSSGLGYTLARGPVARGFWRLAPVLAAFSLAFGVWYTAAALQSGLS